MCYTRYFEYDGVTLRWGEGPDSLTDNFDLTKPGVTLASAAADTVDGHSPPEGVTHAINVEAPERSLQLAFADIHNRNAWIRDLSTSGSPQPIAPADTKLSMPERVQMTLRVPSPRTTGVGADNSGNAGDDEPYMQFWVASPPSLGARAQVVGLVDTGDDSMALRQVMPDNQDDTEGDAAGAGAGAGAGVSPTGQAGASWAIARAARSRSSSSEGARASETFNFHVMVHDVSQHSSAWHTVVRARVTTHTTLCLCTCCTGHCVPVLCAGPAVRRSLCHFARVVPACSVQHCRRHCDGPQQCLRACH